MSPRRVAGPRTGHRPAVIRGLHTQEGGQVKLVDAATLRGIAAAATAVGVVACGGTGDTTDESVESFCNEMRSVDTEVGGENFDPTDPTSVRDAFASLEPPEPIEDDFAVLVAAFDRLIETGAAPTTDERAETYEATVNIDRYVSSECGFELDGFVAEEPPDS